ncbi:MAG: hypothetical protein HY053_01095 [Proteobacteria bacterium]|nr:hypothetical protein [Pseudomonadota bacterium]
MTRKEIIDSRFAELEKRWRGELEAALTPPNATQAQQQEAQRQTQALILKAWRAAQFENVSTGFHVLLAATGVVALAAMAVDIALTGGTVTVIAWLNGTAGLGSSLYVLKENLLPSWRRARHWRDAAITLARAEAALEGIVERHVAEANEARLHGKLTQAVPRGIPHYNFYEFQAIARPVMRHAFAGEGLSGKALDEKVDGFLRECLHEAVMDCAAPTTKSGALVSAMALGGGVAGLLFKKPEALHAVLGVISFAALLYALGSYHYYQRIENRQFDHTAERKPLPHAKGHHGILILAEKKMVLKLAKRSTAPEIPESFVGAAPAWAPMPA